MKRPELRLAGLLLAGALGALGAPAALAAHPTPCPPTDVLSRGERPEPGRHTRDLLAAQRCGTQASPSPQWLSGDVQAAVYRRYVDSFSRPIPERFIDKEFSDSD